MTSTASIEQEGRDARTELVIAIVGREDLNQLPVVEDGHLEGMISRGHILRLLQSRAELAA